MIRGPVRACFKTTRELAIGVVSNGLVVSPLDVKSQRVPDALWAKVKELLPPAVPKRKGGRPPVDDRAALTGILFVCACYERRADIHQAFLTLASCILLSLALNGRF